MLAGNTICFISARSTTGLLGEERTLGVASAGSGHTYAEKRDETIGRDYDHEWYG